jgi:hypothetical protein
MERVLAGSANPEAMVTAYAALRGEVPATEGVDASELRSPLTASIRTRSPASRRCT